MRSVPVPVQRTVQRARRLLVAVALILLGDPCAVAQTQPTSRPAGGVSVIAPEPIAALRPNTEAVHYLRHTPIDVAGQPFTRAVRAEAFEVPPDWWDAQLKLFNAAPVDAGDVLLATFHVRGVASPDAFGDVSVVFQAQAVAPPWPTLARLEVRIPAGAAWQRVHVPFQSDRAFAPGELQIVFNFGRQQQTVDVGGIEVVNYGKWVRVADLPSPDYAYPGRAPDAPWRTAAAERIERIRKGDLVVEVTDAGGGRVKDANVRVEMTRHAFAVGSCVRASMFQPERDEDADARRYREVVERHFNKVTFESELKWPYAEGDVELRDDTDRALAWLRARGVAVRGHVLVWPGLDRVPKDVRELVRLNDAAALRERVNGHIVRHAGAYAGRLAEWDVVNEPFTNHALMDVLGDDAMVEWFRLARRADPKARLFLNEFMMLSDGAPNRRGTEHFYDTARSLLDRGAPLDAIGEQAHFRTGVMPPERALAALDRFATLGLPVLITEFDVDGHEPQFQADYTRDFLTLAFSHPAVEGVILWGFWERTHWRPGAALWRADWSLKPNGRAFLDLFTKQWWTRQAGKTGADGRFATRGFLGRYRVAVDAGGRRETIETELKPGKTTVRVDLGRTLE